VKRSLLTAIVVGALACPSVASAAATQIQVGDDFYAPANAPVRNLAAGPSFNWVRAPGATSRHNVRQDVGIFNSGSLTSSINFTIRASAGTFGYFCTLHGTPTSGMQGTVSVRPTHTLAPAGLPFTVSWALGGAAPTNTGNQFDVHYRVGTTGLWRIWRNDTPTRSGVFGQGNQPVQVIAGRTYQFRARSQKTPSQPSGWSPVRNAIP
jgi:plastocyanin